MKFSVVSVIALGSIVAAQDLGSLLASCASNQFQELGLKGVSGDPCKSEAGKPSYYKCSCTTGRDFIVPYLCKNPGSCSPNDIPKLTDTLVSFCKSVGVTIDTPSDPCGLNGAGVGGGGGGKASPSAPAPVTTTPLQITPAGTAPPGGTAVRGTPITPVSPSAGTPTSFTGAAAQYNFAHGLAGVAGAVGLLAI